MVRDTIRKNKKRYFIYLNICCLLFKRCATAVYFIAVDNINKKYAYYIMGVPFRVINGAIFLPNIFTNIFKIGLMIFLIPFACGL